MPAPSINNAIGQRFIKLLKVDSTNNYAMQRLQNGVAEHGDAYFAVEQTAGKGQFNRQWLSPKGENIVLSVVLDTGAFSLDQQFILNMIAALSAQQLFNKYSAEKSKIKWPNDIYWRDRKAAGILIENTIRGTKWQYAVVGFGININQTSFQSQLKNPVSLKQITGKRYDVIELAHELCSILDKEIRQLSMQKESPVLEKYNAELYKLDQVIQLKKGYAVLSGLVKGVDRFGKLIIESNGEHAFETGAVEWLHNE
ncbi:MAG TPA: biotin--[acetyl-CoA-carboxylase] ligase [Parafilimonas sp.]|nr:biotin--[acetyl-CoA-carboxylase] ligase [Parafilimonas sp.]